jgi:hypothetical protein
LWGDSEEGVYKTDRGTTWNKVLFVDNKTGCSDLIIDPKIAPMYAFWNSEEQVGRLAQVELNSALYKSVDSGKTWNKIHTGFPAGQLVKNSHCCFSF